MERWNTWLIIGGALILAGGLAFVCLMTALNWDFSRLSTVPYVANTYEFEETIYDLDIETTTVDINFVVADIAGCRVECYEEDKAQHSVTVIDHKLIIEAKERKSWYDYIQINFTSPKITIYLPAGEFHSLVMHGQTGDVILPELLNFTTVDISLRTGDIDFRATASGTVKMQTTTGDIHAENASARAMDICVSTGTVRANGVNCEEAFHTRLSTGDLHLTNVRCGQLTTSGSTGDVILEDVIAAESISIKRTTGDVRFQKCDAAEISIQTNTGDVTGDLLSNKVFHARAKTGAVHVPISAEGGRCEVTTTTGDITIQINQSN